MTAKSGREIPPFGDRREGRIGLLGGSFNPAHEGHLHLSREALKRLGLDEVWWLVSPQNPLKSAADMAPLTDRLAGARKMAADPRIKVTDLERRLGTARTARTLGALTARFKRLRFVWLMGADNLAQMPQWWRWTQIFKASRVAVFDRSPYSYGALAGAAAKRFSWARVSQTVTLWHRKAPVWTYVAMRRHPASATAIRNAKKH
ncbi:MAG: nicotinate-nucleotide adenylyltransferase [Proteobacteria bacterium]|nr:nicotinate-nucleotide adenylyltransferase [Pseudomonadota bacterium]